MDKVVEETRVQPVLFAALALDVSALFAKDLFPVVIFQLGARLRTAFVAMTAAYLSVFKNRGP